MYWWEQQKLPEFLSTIVAELVLATVAIFFFNSLVQTQARCAPFLQLRIKIIFITLCVF